MEQKPWQTRFQGTADRSLYSPQGERKYLNSAERRRFLEAAHQSDPDTRALCLVLAYTGCRISEALSLTTSSIQAGENLIAVRSLKKRGKLHVREIPIPTAVTAALLNRRQGPPPDRPLYPFQRTEAWLRVKAVMTAANITGPHASPRGLRHGFAVSAVLAGVPLNVVQKWLGHTTIATTAIYANAVGEEERELMGKVWKDNPSL